MSHDSTYIYTHNNGMTHHDLTTSSGMNAEILEGFANFNDLNNRQRSPFLVFPIIYKLEVSKVLLCGVTWLILLFVSDCFRIDSFHGTAFDLFTHSV